MPYKTGVLVPTAHTDTESAVTTLLTIEPETSHQTPKAAAGPSLRPFPWPLAPAVSTLRLFAFRSLRVSPLSRVSATSCLPSASSPLASSPLSAPQAPSLPAFVSSPLPRALRVEFAGPPAETARFPILPIVAHHRKSRNSPSSPTHLPSSRNAAPDFRFPENSKIGNPRKPSTVSRSEAERNGATRTHHDSSPPAVGRTARVLRAAPWPSRDPRPWPFPWPLNPNPYSKGAPR